jgi:integrase
MGSKRNRQGKRGHGEGNIRKRPDGRWEARVTVGVDSRGRQRRRSVYGNSRAEVAEELTRAQTDRIEGILIEPRTLRLGKYLETWLEAVSRRRTRETTHREYGRLVGHIRRHLGTVALAKIGSLHLEALQSALEREKVGARTRQAVHRLLHLALRDAQRRGLVRVNAANVATAPRAPRAPVRVLDAADLHKLLAAATTSRIGPLVELLAGTGLRIGEALALRWKDLDLASRRVCVERGQVELTTTDRDGNKTTRILFTEPKSAASRRTLGLPGSVVAALEAYRAKLKATPHPQRLVFTDSRGGPWRRSNLMRREWHPLLETAGLTRMGFHVLRHSHASALLAAGLNPRAIAARLGHSRPSLVLDVYGHLLPGADDDLTAAAEAIVAAGMTQKR